MGQAVLRIKQLNLSRNYVAYAGLEFLIILPPLQVLGLQEFMTPTGFAHLYVWVLTVAWADFKMLC